jgi:Zn-finger nucleic acid-binding protein
MVICANCKVREGTNIWSEGAIAYVHGCYSMWCDRCVVDAHLTHARARAAEIPELERRLKELDSQSLPVLDSL